MDVYHKVLLKLYQVTGGKDSQTVDLKDLVKNQGFLGNYSDIFQMLSGQGWIVEASKLNYVRITHWGVKEVKNSANGAPDAAAATKKDTDRLVSETKQLLILLDELNSDITKLKLNQVEKKFGELTVLIAQLKNTIE